MYLDVLLELAQERENARILRNYVAAHTIGSADQHQFRKESVQCHVIGLKQVSPLIIVLETTCIYEQIATSVTKNRCFRVGTI